MSKFDWWDSHEDREIGTANLDSFVRVYSHTDPVKLLRFRSVLRGGSTALFMFAYCIYFYLKSNMSGVLQTFFFFGYSACMCYAFFLMLGALSFRASLIFVRHIYHGDKSE